MSNTTVKVTFRANRSAALIAGRVLGETVDIELDPATFPRWPEFAEKLSIKGDAITCTHNNCSVVDTTPEAALEAWRACLAKKDEKEAEEVAELEKAHAALDKLDIPNLPTQTVRIHADDVGVLSTRSTGTSLGVIAEFKAPPEIDFAGVLRAAELPFYGAATQGRLRAVHERARSIAAEVCAARQAAITEYMEANAEGLGNAARLQASDFFAKKESEKAAAKAAKEAKFAERLETGRVVFETDRYNDRRYGKPWGAKVTLAGSKLVYDFDAATVTASYGSGGVIEIPCQPGEVIARGQKDNRRPSSSENIIYKMREDGGLDTIDRVQALNHLREQLKTA